jgi:hypothetical protein
VSTEITIVEDLTSMFTNSNLDALWDPSALANFDFWRSAMFYISVVLTAIWFLLVIWGWRKDLADMRREAAKKAVDAFNNDEEQEAADKEEAGKTAKEAYVVEPVAENEKD